MKIPALKLRDQLVVAVPPSFYRSKGAEFSGAVPGQPIAASQLGFEFRMPNFTGFDESNRKVEFDDDRVTVVAIVPVEPRTDLRAPLYSDVNEALNRLAGVFVDLARHDVRAGLTCYESPAGGPERTCVGRRAADEDLILDIVVPPYPDGVRFPLMQTTYYTKKYGGLQVTWRAHMKHFSSWLEIDRQIWQFVDQWNIAK